MTDTVSEVDEAIDLQQLDFAFAIRKIDPRLGRIEATQVSWPIEGEKTKTPIDMVDCEELVHGEGMEDDEQYHTLFDPHDASRFQDATFLSTPILPIKRSELCVVLCLNIYQKRNNAQY